jgi:RNA polymerase sigma factor (sigma-70 family)
MPPEMGPAPASTSYTLIQLVQKQDQQAWQTFSGLYSGYIQQRLRLCGIRESDVEDLTQEVLSTVANRVGDFQPQHANGSFRGWVKQVVRSKAVDHFRKEKHTPQAAGGSVGLELEAETEPVFLAAEPDEAAEATAVAELYQRALDVIQGNFETKTWQMFLRVVMEEQSPADVAAEFQVSAAAVRMSKVRILRKLRETLGEPME